MKKDDEKAFDRKIGKRLHDLRIARGMSLMDLAEEIGVAYQQVQKYEAGINVASPWKLAGLAQIFGVPVASFFEAAEKAPVEQVKKETRLMLLLGRRRRIDEENPDAFKAICEMAKAFDTKKN